MTRRIAMQWNLRQVMASRAIYQTSELVPLLAERGVNLSREHVYRLVTKTPQRLNMEILAALCDILDCEPNDLLQPVVETLSVAKTGTDAGPDRAQVANARAGVGAGLGDAERFDHGLEQVVRFAVQDVAQGREDLHVQPLRGLGDQPVDVLARQVHPALGQQRNELTGLVDRPAGHHLAQVPLHRDTSGHHWSSLPLGA